MPKVKLKSYVADFETTTNPKDCRVWGWGLASVDADPDTRVGTTIDQFMKVISGETGNYYFHNLAFDGSFIIDWLFRNDYEHTEDEVLAFGEFKTLISNMGKFFTIEVRWFNGQRAIFKDSLKKLPMSVSNVAKAFQLAEGKGEIDYHLPRPVGYIPTDEEYDYIRRDVEIVARALHKQFSAGMTKLTVGSDSLNDYKKDMGRKMFESTFPILSPDHDAVVRRAYRGGFTYADPRFREKRCGAGSVYDVNSLYPWVMRTKLLPYGTPKLFEGYPETDEDYPLFVVSITFTAKLKKNHIPCIQVKGHPLFSSTAYQEKIDEPTTMVCSSVDLELWETQYDMDILSYNGGFLFHATTGLFDRYIDKWMNVKANSEGGMRAIAKLHLNSLYGKFATNPDVTGKVPIFEDNVVKLVPGKESTRDPIYTPMGIFITAYARQATITAAQLNYETFAYADTDSLHLLTTEAPQGITVDPSALGAWKHEYNFTEAVYLRAKQYAELREDGVTEVHVAGLPRNIAEHVTLDDMKVGTEFTGKLMPKRVPGGIVLTETTFTL